MFLRAQSALSAVIILAAVVITGCASTGIPYRPPSLGPGEAATLKGKNATFIASIDGAEVSSGVIIGPIGGNQTTATPGLHRIGITVPESNGACHYTMTVELAKGNTYEFSPKGIFSSTLTIKNVTTGQTWWFDSETLNIYDEAGHVVPPQGVLAR